MRNSKLLCLTVGATCALFADARVMADDTEVFGGANAAPNVLLILDTSGSMNNANGSSTRRAVMSTAAKDLVDSLVSSGKDMNLGLMRYDSNGSGGMVRAKVADVSTNGGTIKSTIDTWKYCGNTPLSETLYESYLYFAGKKMKFGDGSYEASNNAISTGCTESSSTSITGSFTGDSPNKMYITPMTESCQKNYVVFLTDGYAYEDTSADSLIKNSPTHLTTPGLGATCYSSQANMWSSLGVTEPSESHSGGLCLKGLAKYMYDTDLSDSLTGTQNVVTYFVGFGEDVAGGAAQAYLQDAANAGGGKAYTATDAAGLAANFEEIFSGIAAENATFAAPSVAVNSFNKTQVLEDMYVSVFKPTSNVRWPGNLKKYKFRDGQIVGKAGAAVNPATGFFRDEAQDYWSNVVDGANVVLGGAANKIPAPASRKIYTYIGSNPSGAVDLTGDINHTVSIANPLLTKSLLGIPSATDDQYTTLVNWARGQDVDDVDHDNSVTDARNDMGDPIHSQPALIIYGNTGSTTTQKLNDAVAYVATNDGYLHAFDAVTGEELWSYIPEKLLSDLRNLYANSAIAQKHYSLDGDIRVLKYDVNGDGIVNGNDRVILYFSQGRGGSAYFALDVTSKTRPKFMWTLDGSDIGDITQSWSTPTLGRVQVAGAVQNSQKLVLIFGGGYDIQHENPNYFAGDPSGNAIYLVDAINGSVLWRAGDTACGNCLKLDKMTHAIPSNVTVLDTDNDGWSDRMYVGDLAGQLWRFDITNNEAASTLVAGGVIASLGHQTGDSGNASNRRFFNAPDVAAFKAKGVASYYNIAIGSGYRGHPKNTETQDRFYAIRDYNLYTKLDQDQYDNYSVVTDSALTDISTAIYGSGTVTLPAGAKGWKLPLGNPSWQGEKVLAPSITVDGTVMFTSYIPPAGGGACTAGAGTGRAYSIKIDSATKRFDEAYETFAVTGLPPSIAIFNEDQLIKTDDSGDDDDDNDDENEQNSVCLSGVSVLGNCVDFGDRIKTYWQESGTN